MSSKRSSKGTAILLDIASVYTVIPAVDSIKGPPQKPETVDTSSLNSLIGRENTPTGYSQGGVASGSLFFDPSNIVHLALLTLLGAPSLQFWSIIWPDTTSWSFTGTLTDFASVTARVGEFLKTNFEIQLTGTVAF